MLHRLGLAGCSLAFGGFLMAAALEHSLVELLMATVFGLGMVAWIFTDDAEHSPDQSAGTGKARGAAK